ncbi:neural cell adhesion molecule 1-A-like, partial [Centruroides sculpturatus]
VSKAPLYLSPEGTEHAFFTNESFFITCYAIEDSSATRLTWQAPSGKDITVSEGRVYVAPVAHNSHGLELVVEEVRRKDAGRYTCSAIVDGQEVTTHFNLQVYRSISFAHTPPVQLAPEGSNFTVFCNVKAEPRPIMSWYFRSRLLTPGIKYQITEDGLVIHRITREDSGNYTCRAIVVAPRNSQIKEITIVVQVQYSPHWKRPHMRRGYSSIGLSTNLTCEARANPAPSFEWLKDGEILKNHNIYKTFHEDDRSVLQIKVHNASMFGEYLCRVSNVLGVKERTIVLEQGVKPPPPKISVIAEDPGMLILYLNDPLERDDNLRLLGYRVEYKQLSEAWPDANSQEFGVASKYILRNLVYNTDYVIRVAARNAAGFGKYSTEVIQRTRGLLADPVIDNNGAPNLHSALIYMILLLLGKCAM